MGSCCSRGINNNNSNQSNEFNLSNNEVIEKVSVNEVIWWFLNAEKGKLSTRIRESSIITHPDLTNSQENTDRYRLLMGISRQLWLQLPPDITWLKVTMKKLDSSHDRRLITPWPVKYNSVQKVDLNRIICISSSLKNNWTVIEGNHRVSQWRRNNCPSIKNLIVYVGISEMDCCWSNSKAKSYVHFDNKKYQLSSTGSFSTETI
jgi:hypothetical protein